MERRSRNFIGACLTLMLAFALWPTVAHAIGWGEAEAAAKGVIKRLFGGEVNLTAATTGQVPVKQANGSWAPGAAGGTIGGSLGATDNAILTADGTGGATAQGTTATLDAGVLTLPAGGSVNATTTGFFALGTTTSDPRLAKDDTDGFKVVDGGGSPGYLNVADLYATNGVRVWNTTTTYALLSSVGFGLPSGGKLNFTNSATSASATVDTALSRDAAGRVLVENGSGTAADLRLAGLVIGAASTTAGARWEMSGNNLTLREGDDSTGFADIVDLATASVLGRVYAASYTTDPITESALNSGAVLDNVGASGTITVTLPNAANGVVLTYWIGAAQQLRIDPQADDKILDLTMTGLADGEYVVSSTLYSRIKIMATSTGDWIVLDKAGTWAEETP